MKNRKLLLLSIMLFISMCAMRGLAQTTAFTYQGKLTQSGVSPTAPYDMQFRLFDDPDPGEGTQQGTPVSVPAVQVTNGIFTTQLDFGPAVFSTGADLYLEVSLRPAGSGAYTSLGPRQRLTSTPYATRAQSAANADNATNAASATIAGNSNTVGGLGPSSFILKAGDTMTGPLSLPPNGLLVGTNQILTSGGNVAIGAVSPSVANKLYVAQSTPGYTAIYGENTSQGLDSIGSTSYGVFGRAMVYPGHGVGGHFEGSGMGISAEGFANNYGSPIYGISGRAFGSGGTRYGVVGSAFGGTRNYGGYFNSGVGINGGAPWTSDSWGTSLELNNAGAVGWLPNTSSQSFGIGQTNSGLRIFRTTSSPGSTSGSVVYVMAIGNNGNVGIGEFGLGDGPTATLHVAGTLQTGLLTGGSGVAVCRYSNSILGVCGSSARFKKDIIPFAAGIDLLARLRPVSYTWKSDGKPDLGLVAEEVAEVEPRLVNRDEKGEIVGVKYDHLTAVLINAVKEQQSQIEAQREKDNLQQKQIEQQQAQIDALKKLVCSHNSQAEVCKEYEQ